MTPRPLSCLSHQSRQGGYPFHCPRGATPLLLVVNGRRRHNGWGSGTASWCLGAVKWIPPSAQIDAADQRSSVSGQEVRAAFRRNVCSRYMAQHVADRPYVETGLIGDPSPAPPEVG